MSLYAAGRVTGLTVDFGYNDSRITPVFEGFSLPNAVEKMGIGGRILTDWM